MTQDYLQKIEAIFDCIDEVMAVSAKFTLEELSQDTGLYGEVIRKFEALRDTIKSLPKEFTDKYPDVHWDVLVSDYRQLSTDNLFKLSKNDLPAFWTNVAIVYKKEKGI